MNRARFRLFCRKHCSRDQQLALRDPQIFDAALEEVNEQYQNACAGRIQDFLDWLLENREKIFEFIQKIISLFV